MQDKCEMEGFVLPEFFAEMLAEQYDAHDVERILEGCTYKRAVTLRANTLLANRKQIENALDEAKITWSSVNWYEDAFILSQARERDVWELPIYREGQIYLQSLSSMIPALVLSARAGEDVCDMCAAPGGKTTQIAALSGGAYVTACEMHAPRAEKLEYNLQKLGATNVTVMRCDARRLDDFFSFDRVLVDAPCSGSGTLRANDERVTRRFTPALIEKSTKAQKALLTKGLSLLRPGGTLVYSTCSVFKQENEDIVEAALASMRSKHRSGTFKLKAVEIASNNLPLLPSKLEGTLTLCPSELYEGFFVAKIFREM